MPEQPATEDQIRAVCGQGLTDRFMRDQIEKGATMEQVVVAFVDLQSAVIVHLLREIRKTTEAPGKRTTLRQFLRRTMTSQKVSRP